MGERTSGTVSGLRLRAEDEGDLAVFAACLQGARTRRADMTYLKGQHRFAILFDRYCWEDAEAASRTGDELPSRIVRCGLHFEGVLAVATQGFEEAEGEPLDLLTILCRRVKGGGEIHLLFEGGAALRLGVECVEAALADLADPAEGAGGEKGRDPAG